MSRPILFASAENTATRLEGVVRRIRGADLAQLNKMIARLDHGRSDLVGARGEQAVLVIFASAFPTPDDDF